MSVLNCKVGEIWLNSQNHERKILYVDEKIIVSSSEDGTRYTYFANGNPMSTGTVYSLTKKKSEIIRGVYKAQVPVYLNVDDNKLSFGFPLKYSDTWHEHCPNFIKWLDIEVEVSIEK